MDMVTYLIKWGPSLPNFPQFLEEKTHSCFGLRYDAEHVVGAIQRNPYCRVCGHTYPGEGNANMFCGDALCGRYRVDHRFQQLVRVLLMMQLDVFEHCRENYPWPGPRAGFNIQQAYWWEFVTVLDNACEISLQVLGRCWEMLIEKNGLPGICDGIISHIEEMRVSTPLYYGHIVHCAFRITLDDGSYWVFDPTGVQFGPHWALLTPFDEYCRKCLTTTLSRKKAIRFYNLGDSFRAMK